MLEIGEELGSVGWAELPGFEGSSDSMSPSRKSPKQGPADSIPFSVPAAESAAAHPPGPLSPRATVGQVRTPGHRPAFDTRPYCQANTQRTVTGTTAKYTL